MERSEPSLVPEWLKNTGSQNGGGSLSHSDDHAAGKFVKKPFVNNNNNRSDRATSSYFNRSYSSNGSSNPNPYSNFGRNRHDRDWDNKDTYDSRDRSKVVLGDRRHRISSDPLEDTLSSKFERDGLRRSQSMISGRREETWPKKVVTDSSTAGRNTINNGFLTKGGGPVVGVRKTSFERDFPSLGNEEVRRVPSPGLSSAIQSLPIGNSATIGGEKWTSALAEAPVLVGNNGNVTSSSQQAPSLASGTTTSLNMAEAVAQGPKRAQATPQLSVGTQKLEELAIKQSRQLIPVRPSMPKTLALSSSDKQKTKVGLHPVSSSLAINHSPRGGSVRGGDAAMASSNVGKLQVLKPVREKNGVTLVKDNSSPTLAPTAPSVSATRGPPNPGHKSGLTVLEKRPTSQARSRNEFFNLVRKKSVPDSASVADIDISPGAANTSESGDALLGVVIPSGAHLSDVRSDFTSNGDASQEYVGNGKIDLSSDPVVPDEEEAAFLRSLGWEENSDEGFLTEEEINAFYRDYINSKPSLKILQEVTPKFSSPFDSRIGGIPSGLSSPGTKLKS